MERKKIVVVVSGINKSIYFEQFLSRLTKENFDIYVILLNSGNTLFEQFLDQQGIRHKRIVYSSKAHLFITTLRLIVEFLKFRPKIVHAHLFEAGLTAMFASVLTFIRKRIYTRHHSDLHHVYHPQAVKYDRLINFLATDVIAVSEIVKEILISKETCPAKKVNVIPNAFDFSIMSNISEERKSILKKKYSIPNEKFIVGVMSRFVEWKGIFYIIEAFKEINKTHPDSFLILANARGPKETEIRRELKKLPSDCYILVDFEPDNYALFTCFDVFIHVPVSKYSESFGQVYAEAVFLKVPLIATLSGIASEILVDDNNCLIVPYRDSKAIYSAFCRLRSDELLRIKLKNAELPSNISNFDFSHHIRDILGIYSAS